MDTFKMLLVYDMEFNKADIWGIYGGKVANYPNWYCERLLFL